MKTKMDDKLSQHVQVMQDGYFSTNCIGFCLSTSCVHCRNLVPIINELAEPSFRSSNGISDYSVQVVYVEGHVHTLRSQGIDIVGVPHIVIKTSLGNIISYQGQRMATEIAQAAADVLTAGSTEVVPVAEPVAPLAAGATEAAPVADALLGGASEAPVADLAAGAKKRKGGKKSRGSKKSKKSKGSKKSRGSRKSKGSRKYKKRMMGGAELEAGEIEGGAKKQKRSRSKSRSKKQTPWMRAVMAQYEKGQKKSKSYTLKQAMKSAKRTYRKSKSRSRK